ncbi:hypothetical protein BE61_30160 [Bradyrhizobium elkanii USDA 61]|nr:hypothetical protein BE61_30160 [Bradyrhizobium elkanii USDA 61]
MAGRRLRQIEPHRGAADIGFAQQGVERDQQIEVKRIQIHRVNIYHITYRLEECAARPQDWAKAFSREPKAASREETPEIRVHQSQGDAP